MNEPIDPQQLGLRDRVAVPRYVVISQGLLIVVLSAAAFSLGVYYGRNGPRQPDLTGPFKISGDVSFRVDGGFQSDSDCAVIFLPTDERPDEKISIAGLAPGEPMLDDDFGPVAVIRSLGGDYSRTDRNGEYRLEVAKPGPYYTLVLSRHAPYDASELTKKDLAILGRYFRPADALIDGLAHQMESIKIVSDDEISFKFR